MDREVSTSWELEREHIDFLDELENRNCGLQMAFAGPVETGNDSSALIHMHVGKEEFESDNEWGSNIRDARDSDSLHSSRSFQKFQKFHQLPRVDRRMPIHLNLFAVISHTLTWFTTVCFIMDDNGMQQFCTALQKNFRR